MSDKAQQNTGKPLVESTSVTYEAHALPASTATSDGQATCMRYYTGDDAKDATRSDQLPSISSLIKGLKLADGTDLATAAALQCPQIIDASQPPLLARLEYLKFDGTATSAATLTLCGYAKATRDAQGRLMPDTVLVLEGVTVAGSDGEAKGWAVSLDSSWSAIKATLAQSTINTVAGAVQSITRTATTWYKDNNARRTQQVTEATYTGKQAGTWKVVTKAPLTSGGDAILSQQIVSAFSGRLLRESHQDSDGKPVRFTCHEYDTRGRGTRSVVYTYDEALFDSGDAAGIQALTALEEQNIEWFDTGSGTRVTTTRADGREQRTLYDGMQRAVKRELQREVGGKEYVALETSTWGRGEDPLQTIGFDYLPGGLCIADDGPLAVSSQLRHQFWQAQVDPVVTQNTAKEQTLSNQWMLALTVGGVQHTKKQTQLNHAAGAVTLSSALWEGDDTSDENKALKTEEKTDARGRKVQFKQQVPLGDGTFKSREYTATWDDLNRQTKAAQPDGSVVTWSYRGLSEVPVQVSITAKGGTEQVLGSQTLQGAGNTGDSVTGTVAGGAKGLAYSEQAGTSTGPDGTTLYPSETDNGVSWYIKGKGDKTAGTLLASFTYTALTRALKAERPAEGEQQTKVTSEVLGAALLGGWHFNRTVHAQKQRQEALVSLRGRLQQTRHANGVISTGWGGLLCERVRRGALEYWYEYTALGQCERMTVRDLGNGRCMAVSYTYDKFGNETERQYRLDDTTKARYVQTWSSIGQLLSKALYRDGSETAVRSETFVYCTSTDGTRDELQKWTVTATTGNEIKDAAGNTLKEQSYQYDVLGSLTQCTTLRADGSKEVVTYKYEDTDHPTRRTSQGTQLTPKGGQAGAARTLTYTYDANGQLTLNDQEQTLAYSSTGALRSVTEKGQSTALTYYEYHERDGLVSQTDVVKGERRILAYSGQVLCSETWLDKDNQVTRTLTLDELAGAVVNDCQGTVNTQLFVLGDPQQAGGDEYWVDANGAWQYRSLAFTPWGEAPQASQTAMQSGLGHNGQRLDPITGCAHLGNGYRIYDPRHRAFYQRDSWSPFGDGGLNDRAYCAGGDPVNYHDPSGHIMLSRYDQNACLARLDSAIAATKPPVHDAAPWWQWLLLGVFAVVAIVATIATFGSAGPVMAGIGMLVCSGIAAGTVITAVGMAMRQSNPRLSSRLEGAGHIVAGVASLPGMVMGLPAILGGIVVATTLASVALEAARLAVEQENPALAEKLGWASLGVGLAGMAAMLPSLLKGLDKFMLKLRGLRARVSTPIPDGVRSPVSARQADRIGEFSDLHNNVPISNPHRKATWHMHKESGGRYFWGVDAKIRGGEVEEALIAISQRPGSASSVHIESGGHGNVSGNNWVRGAGRFRPDPIRDTMLDERLFYIEDVQKYAHLRRNTNLPASVVTPQGVMDYNARHGTNILHVDVVDNLVGRNIHVHDIGHGISNARLNKMEQLPGHHLGAFCFSRNDERWLFRYKMFSVTSHSD